MRELVPPTAEILGGSAVATAQSVIQSAMNSKGFTLRRLAREMNVHREFVKRMMTRGLSVEEFGLALAACGYQAKFSYEPITARWNPDALS